MSHPDDLALLRRFEPVVRYTKGEQFFPMDVDTYVQTCSFWVHRPNKLPLRLYPETETTLKKLAEPRADGPNVIYYLKFIEPMNLAEMAAYRLREGLTRKDDQEKFHAGPGRLARVGYGSRFVDALFSLSLLARGRVPGDTAVAAARAYKALTRTDRQHYYYGRVVRRQGWIALQYWFFYAFNNWRSGFFGANDHEADWEMVYIYLYEDKDGAIKPEWVAYAAHDFEGDDLRRRWDDPEVEKIGEHPIIYAGAGSHASYFQAGEYLAELELPFAKPALEGLDRFQTFWEKNVLRYPAGRDERPWSDYSIFRVPFVDYARGDGLAIGPGQQKEWNPVLIDPPPAWVSKYRGLWGLYAHDPFSGEDAPAGPMYNRDGSVRRSWYDPLGWAGLDKLPPPQQQLEQITLQKAKMDERQAEMEAEIERKAAELQGLGIELFSLQNRPHLKEEYRERQRQINRLSEELNRLQSSLATDEALEEALELYAGHIKRGARGSMRAHISRAHHPTSDEGLRLSRFAEAWAALSIGLMIIAFILLILFARDFLLFGLVALVSLLAFIEASFRRRVTRVIASFTIGLAFVSALIILFEFFWPIIIVTVLIAGSYIMWENLNELRR